MIEIRQRPRRIVMVEDNPSARRSLCDLLREMGHEVEAADDGPSGFALVEARQPEIVLIDINLPGFDGYQLARLIREQYPTDAMRLVALTGWDLPDFREEIDSESFDRYLAKPIDLEELERELSLPMDGPHSGEVVASACQRRMC